MKDLMAVYEHAYLDAHTQAEVRLDSLVHYMKAFIEAHEAKSEFAGKLDNLRDKLGLNQCNDCDEDEEC